MEKDVFRALQSCPLYENISDEDIMRSMKDIPYELVQYPKKAIYKKTGQPIEFADIIVSGEVNIKLESKTGKRATVISHGIGRIVAPSVIFFTGKFCSSQQVLIKSSTSKGISSARSFKVGT